jgi:hypothetical protein
MQVDDKASPGGDGSTALAPHPRGAHQWEVGGSRSDNGGSRQSLQLESGSLAREDAVGNRDQHQTSVQQQQQQQQQQQPCTRLGVQQRLCTHIGIQQQPCTSIDVQHTQRSIADNNTCDVVPTLTTRAWGCHRTNSDRSALLSYLHDVTKFSDLHVVIKFACSCHLPWVSNVLHRFWRTLVLLFLRATHCDFVAFGCVEGWLTYP